MWILIVTTIWAISGGVKADNVRVFDSECDCMAAKTLLERGKSIEAGSSSKQTYSCLEMPLPAGAKP